MAPKPSKPKPLTFPFILFLIALLIFTIHYLKQLHNEFHTSTKSARNPKWFKVVAREMGDENINIGFVNMDETTITDEVHTRGKMVKVRFNPVDEGIEWSDLFPEWIDENSPSNCPELPMPKFEDYGKLDVVVARVPCTGDSGLRNVFRLQVNLVVANFLVRSGRVENGVSRPVFAVFIGSCGPMWEIFRCDDLLWHGGNSWVYKPELRRIKQKVFMPVGSCQLAPPFAQSGEELWRRHSETSNKGMPREAYVTVLHSSEAYVCGAIALAQSIIQSNSTKDLVLLADDHISEKSIHGLQSAGWKIKRIKRIRSPHSKKDAYNEWNYSKLRIWQLREYDKVMFIDSDLIVTRNLDDFFIYPQLSAVGNDKHIFNSGLMLVEPSMCTFKTLMKKRFVVGSYNGGDQGFLNEVFPWWHRLPAKLNQLKFFGSDHDYTHEIPHDMYTIHYLGLKPWMCYKDYDCNWDKSETQIFASDSANERWWSVYDTMPKKLRHFCSLTPAMDARIQKYRSRAKNASFPDGHWKIKVKDPRRNST
ncbi:UNVERIFIED_CONTAM: putative UDP-glucuronate:xylan alpha-glucuronosyltransferase 4 [Sesamum radiatum]|uniref:Hexosyltransferase n=1 Tax=Sesamum radiatum TaxID=300843 RepID=A0AAW2NPP3_SESRA